MRQQLAISIFFLLCVWQSAFGQGSCTSPQNVIVAENCNTGTTGWEISGVGDLTIQGFSTDISVNVGQTINFKINTPASSYHVDIYRLGYYGGAGGRLITTIQPSATLPQVQPACLTNSETQLYDCGNWGISASWTVPTTAVSGVYVAAPVRNDTGGASNIVFVVRNDASHSAILFQTSDETWQAYNEYGGHSLYGPTNLFDLTNRAYKVSYNRPFNTRAFEDESVTFLFGTEYPMVRWLEANGYDVTYFTGVDAARNGSLIQNHKIYLSVGHDEYWTGPHRTNVEAARDAGVNLAFFSGNEVFWKTRWENSIDGTNTPFRTLVCYKETLGPNSNPSATAAVDPLDPPTWTGTWRDTSKSPPDDGGRPENSLTGTIFMVNGPGNDNPGNLSIQVPAADGKMRFWRNTSLANLAAGQTGTLPAGTLGYEWDADLDNGSRPAGTFDLSTATFNLTSDLLLDQGGTYGAGTATHHMTLHRAPSGALVFGAGTIQWSWGLDNNHDNPFNFASPPADPDMQQATVNLFADMGVQPGGLQAGLVLATQSADTVSPASTITSPANGSTVRVGTNVTISGTAVDSGGGVVGGVEVSVDGGATWHPANGRENWTYSWTPSASGFYTIRSRATDDSANLETPSAGNTVSASTTAQTLVSLTLNSNAVTSGTSVQGTVTLGQAAAFGGIVVTLSSSNPSVASVPSSVTVPAGQFSANFAVATFAVSVPTSATISGTYVANSSASLTVKAALPPPAGAIAIDVISAQDQGKAATTVTSGAFSTSVGNELILALVGTDALSSNVTVTSVTGGGLTWNLVVRTNTQMGTAEIWRAFAATQISNASITATLSQNVASSLLVLSFAGVDTTGTNGSGAIGATGTANAASGAPSASLTTTRNNSLVLGVGSDWDNAVSRAVGANQTLLHQDLSPTGDTYWMQMQSVPTPTAGTTVTINDTTPTGDRYNLGIVEVRPPSVATLGISGAISPSSSGSGTTLALSGTASATTTADANGNYSFTGLAPGAYTITPTKTAVAFNPTSQPVNLSTTNATGVNFAASTLTSIAVTPANATIAAGGTQQFAATGTYSDSSSQNLTTQVSWSSSKTTVGTINSSGLATGIAGGSATITATLGTISGSAMLTIQAPALVISTTTLTNGTQSQPYNGTLLVSGGTPSYSWSLVNGTTLPPGLTLSTSGQITGSPTIVGATTFTVQVTDSGTPAQTATQSLTVTVNASGCPCVINGTISGIGGNGATVTLAGAGAATVTASSTGTYTFTGLSSGTYTVTPSKPGFIITPTSLSVTITSAGVSGVNFTSTAQLGVDKTVSTDRSSKSTSIASPAFSTAVANELLLAFVASDANSSGITVSGVTGGGLTWSLVKRTNTQLGTAEIWKAFAPTIVANVTVTATLSQSVAASITVVTFTGADATGTGGSGAIGATSTNNANPGAPTASLLTTRNNSWVFGVGGDWDNGIGRTLGVNQTMVHQYLATIGDTYWVQRQTGTTPTSGTLVTINDTAPTTDRYNLSICEVLPAQ
jgi:Bacterial Ig-like domain (group 2)/Bacterial Ig domain